MNKTNECPHLSLVLSITKEELLQKSETGVCTECKAEGPKLWACLQGNCRYIGCGESAKDHSSLHYKEKKHSVTVNLRTFRVWCYSCNKEVHLPSLFTANEMKALKRNAKPRRHDSESQKPSDSLPPFLQTDPNAVPLGLTGLRNLGNTCYMNASLQCLSNCLPLTYYFLNHESPTDPGANMTKNYRKLVNDIWDYNRPSSITPSGCHMALKMINPAFRGYQQQDAQEFLRCIMDRLHEELKYAVSQRQDYDDGSTHSHMSAVPNPSARYDTTSGSTASSNERFQDLHASHHNHQQNIAASTREKVQSKPHHLHDMKSIISDIFDGKLRSSVQCLTCDQVSHTRETFQDLSLPIPGKDDLSRLHGVAYLPSSGSSHAPVVPGFKGPCAQEYSTFGMIYSMWEWLKSWVWGPHISLNDCLAAFFSSDELKGDNMYSCDKCKKLRNGVKYCRLLELPEVVCIHLKRFRHEYLTSYSTKMSNPVFFPLKGLDLRPYLAQDSPSHCTKYDLCSIIVHLGNAGGGHYLAYVKNVGNKKWYEFDDQYVTEVSESTVANSEAYVLFYCKSSAESSRARDRIWNLFQQERIDLSTPRHTARANQNSLMQFLVSVQWFHKFFTFAEPGPIDNRDFVCIHGGILPDKFDQLDAITVFVSEEIWSELLQRYSGGPAITRQKAQPCERCRQEFEELEKRRVEEKEIFLKLYESDACYEDYFIAMTWFRQWEKFLHKKKYDPPEEIDNSSIAIMKDGKAHLKPGSDSGPITPNAWKYLHSIYGGGPAISVKRRSVPQMVHESKKSTPAPKMETDEDHVQLTQEVDSSKDNEDSYNDNKPLMK